MNKYIKQNYICFTLIFLNIVLSGRSFAGNLGLVSDGIKAEICNTGIRHIHQENICSSGLDGNTQICNTNVKGDYLIAEVAPSENSANPAIKTRYLRAGKNDFNSLVGSELPANNNKKLLKLDIYLGSESYGAEYFVELCFRGKNTKNESAVFNLASNIAYAGGDYPKDSSLTVRPHLICHLNETIQLLDELGDFIPFGESFLIVPFSDYSLFIPKQLNRTKCRLRYFFKEQQVGVRKNKNSKANFTIYTNIYLE